MKPNGRRRWRKRAAGQRYKQRKLGCDWDFWKQNRHYALACRHMAKRMGDPPLPSAPAKAFSVRSLVGMTMGSRKRAAYREAIRIGHLDMEMQFRTEYRIGQHLRPCKRCNGPDGAARCVAAKNPGHSDECVFCRTCDKARLHLRFIPDNPPLCDGSGVLPAHGAAK